MNGLKLSSLLFLALFAVTSCSSSGEKTPEQKAHETRMKEKIFDGKAEPVEGRLDVYGSMARIVKYNVDATVDNMEKKVYTYDPAQTPKDIVEAALVQRDIQEKPLFGSMRALNYAIMYASLNLSENNVYLNNHLYEKAGETLALGAIKSHKDALHAIRTTKEIQRFAKREEKNLKGLNDKFEKKGKLSEDDQYYRKGLEVALLRLARIHDGLDQAVEAHAKLIYDNNPKDLQLEGRRFYELYDFDKNLTVEEFQKAAFANRSEFKIAEEFLDRYTFMDVQEGLFRKYPQVERLNINGYNVESPIYSKDLTDRTVEIASLLVNDMIIYKNKEFRSEKIEDEKDKILAEEEVKKAKKRAFDELSIAIFAQIEVAYNLVKQAEGDVAAIDGQIRDLKKEINTLERNDKNSVTNRVELLNNRVKLFELEAKKSEALGERAVAIRSMYFCAGFSPFERAVLQLSLKEMVIELKSRFNTDAVEMLDKILEYAKEEAKLDNEWAKKDNWLETLLDHKEANAKIDRLSQETGVFDQYDGYDYNDRKTMQLGSYKERKNADIEWSMLSELYPELKAYSPKIEKVVVNGEEFNRLIVTSSDGGFKDLCNSLRAARVECILR